MPLFGLTPGDFAGIGPELLLRLALDPKTRAETLLYAPLRLVELTQDWFTKHHPGRVWDGPLRAHSLQNMELVRSSSITSDAVHIVDITPLLPEAAQRDIQALTQIPFAAPRATFAYTQYIALTQAIDDALTGRIDGICTAPWNKALLGLTDIPPTGHTEVLQARTHSPNVTMMLAGDQLRVTLATVHTSLQDVPATLTQKAIVETILTTARALHTLWGISLPHIAVLGLNPHAGEGGLMGHEEETHIKPAMKQASTSLFESDFPTTLSGPLSADTFFTRLHPHHPAGWPFDAVVCMYHDQGLIPLKLHHYGQSANITLGLPILRTSPDHGTAYDIAGSATASIDSTDYALRALRMLVDAKSLREGTESLR